LDIARRSVDFPALGKPTRERKIRVSGSVRVGLHLGLGFRLESALVIRVT
jgi:hypothetical protein